VCALVAARPEVGFVSFTGSVRGGHEVYRAVAQTRFIDVGLELGGKDPAYVAPDADLDHAVANLVDGAFYNAGQSCCGIERIYVHASVYDRFLEGAVAEVRKLRMGDPLDGATTLGPMAQPDAPRKLEAQVAEARSKGGRILCGGKATAVDGKGRFFDPCVVADATHQMHGLMVEESFGPIVGIARVDSDDEAVRLMNDSPYGLTASIWTRDEERAFRVGSQIDTGTFFMNRCDYLDPALPWTGVKDSGKGVSLSRFGFYSVTRRKSFHLRTQT
jgi:acyl-CoA reductase-like NAD-dependent aldehyde dehydrogenase